MNNEPKERQYLNLCNYKNMKNEYYFKKWYMTHTLEWMEGFNEGFKLLSDLIKELKYDK